MSREDYTGIRLSLHMDGLRVADCDWQEAADRLAEQFADTRGGPIGHGPDAFDYARAHRLLEIAFDNP